MTLFEMTLSLDGRFAFILCPIIYVCKNAFLFRGYLRLFSFQHWTLRYDKKRKVSSRAFFFVGKEVFLFQYYYNAATVALVAERGKGC